MNDNNEIYNILLSQNTSIIKEVSNSLIHDNNFLKQIVKVDNPFIFDSFIKAVQYKMDTTVLHEERNKYIKEILLNIDLTKETTIPDRWIIEYIVGYYFQDNYYNFMTNLFQMINYLKNNKDYLIEKDHLNIYKEFADLKAMSLTDKIGFFKLLLNDLNLLEMFYDDMRVVREDSHKELVNSTIKLNKNSDLYQKDISERLNTDIYYLDGEEFFGFVRAFSIKKDDLQDHFDYVFSNGNQLGYSFSYIGDKNIGTIDYSGKNVTLFYDNIDYRNIMYVHHADLHAKKMIVQDDYLSNKENEILTPSSLVARTGSYNEIYIKGNGIKPTALICYDSISIDDINFAKKYGLSILIINKQKYKRYETFDEDYDSYSYVL